jgi:RNA polymerase sigma factor (sigma-70 family)
MGVQGLMPTGDLASFLDLVAEIRPELHRYCARMTGSVVDGEDVLQETLLKTFAALPQMTEVANVKGWVFRLAHNQAVDRWRSYEQRSRTPLESLLDQPDESAHGAPPDEVLAREQALRSSGAMVCACTIHCVQERRPRAPFVTRATYCVCTIYCVRERRLRRKASYREQERELRREGKALPKAAAPLVTPSRPRRSDRHVNPCLPSSRYLQAG